MKRVLMVGYGAVGDTVHAIPAILALRRALAPGDEIWFDSVIDRREGVAPHATVATDLLTPLGLVDRVRHREVPGGRLGIAAIEGLVLAAVLGRRFHRVIVLVPFASLPSLLGLLDRVTSMVAVATDPGTGGPLSGDRPLCWHLLESLRHHGIVEAKGDESAVPFLVPPAAALQEAESWLVRHRRHPERALLAVAPDASYPSNRWPMERFQSLVRTLDAWGDFEVVLCGGRGHGVAFCRDIAAACPGAIVSAGQLSILATAALFRRCAGFVGLDTGTTHLASACGTPFVALYGQRGTGRWFFPPCANGVVLQHDVPCRGCWLTRCDRPGHPCMEGIGVDEVLAAVRKVCHRPSGVHGGTGPLAALE